MTEGFRSSPPPSTDSPVRTPDSSRYTQEVTDTVQRIMGEDIAPPPAPVTPPPTPTSGSDSTTSTTMDVAKQQTAEVADTAKQAGAQVAGTVKEQAGQVTEEAKQSGETTAVPGAVGAVRSGGQHPAAGVARACTRWPTS